jgi:hypothetical protein
MRLGVCTVLLVLAACGSSSPSSVPDAAPQPTTECGSVRYTWYTASKGGWCEYDRTAPMLPESVRAGLTLAIAEPWAGSSYAGVFGEACGECWEIGSLTERRIIMVHDLCPIEGNPVCNGSHFHVDLSEESKTALAVEGIGEASARRVPCPVTGNIHLQILDRNQWGYLRFQVINHRIPIRTVEFRAADDDVYYPAERSGGAWHVLEHGEAFESAGVGGVFRLTSAQGQVLETPNVLGYAVTTGSFFDTGAQLTDQTPAAGPACTFTAPPDIYVDGYGGIERVRWTMNPWSSASPRESSDGCQSGRCLRVSGLGSGAGLHIYYPAAFAPRTFRNLRLFARSDSGTGAIVVKMQGDGYACTETTVDLTTTWSEAVIDLATACTGTGTVSMFTLQSSTAPVVWLDGIRLEM